MSHHYPHKTPSFRTLFALLGLFASASLSAKDCYCRYFVRLVHSDDSSQEIWLGSSGVSNPLHTIWLQPGDQATLVFESGGTPIDCPDARAGLSKDGQLQFDSPFNSYQEVPLASLGFYAPYVTGTDVYVYEGMPFFLKSGTTTGPVVVSPKAWLDGAYVQATGLMRDDLRQGGLLPLVPVTGSTTTTTQAVLAVSGNNAIVDWVSVELRVNTDPAQVAAQRYALLQRDGDIVDVDGTSPLSFDLPAGPYRIVVRHRNHLGVMTLNGITLGGTATVVDFRDPALSTYGTEALKTLGSTRTLWAGDVSRQLRPNRISYTGTSNDRDPILTRVGSTTPQATTAGYYAEDVNLDGLVKYTGASNDRDIILQTIGGTSPTAVRTEQVP